MVFPFGLFEMGLLYETGFLFVVYIWGLAFFALLVGQKAAIQKGKMEERLLSKVMGWNIADG